MLKRVGRGRRHSPVSDLISETRKVGDMKKQCRERERRGREEKRREKRKDRVRAKVLGKGSLTQSPLHLLFIYVQPMVTWHPPVLIQEVSVLI